MLGTIWGAVISLKGRAFGHCQNRARANSLFIWVLVIFLSALWSAVSPLSSYVLPRPTGTDHQLDHRSMFMVAAVSPPTFCAVDICVVVNQGVR